MGGVSTRSTIVYVFIISLLYICLFMEVQTYALKQIFTYILLYEFLFENLYYSFSYSKVSFILKFQA